MLIDIPDGKQLVYPETRQVFNFNCGSNALASMLVYGGVEEREDRVGILARRPRAARERAACSRFNYYGLLCGHHITDQMWRSQLCGVQHESSAISGVAVLLDAT